MVGKDKNFNGGYALMERGMSDNYIYIKNLKMVFTTEISFEVALESWPVWDLNPLIHTHTHTYILKIQNSVCLHVVIVL